MAASAFDKAFAVEKVEWFFSSSEDEDCRRSTAFPASCCERTGSTRWARHALSPRKPNASVRSAGTEPSAAARSAGTEPTAVVRPAAPEPTAVVRSRVRKRIVKPKPLTRTEKRHASKGFAPRRKKPKKISAAERTWVEARLAEAYRRLCGDRASRGFTRSVRNTVSEYLNGGLTKCCTFDEQIALYRDEWRLVGSEPPIAPSRPSVRVRSVQKRPAAKPSVRSVQKRPAAKPSVGPVHKRPAGV